MKKAISLKYSKSTSIITIVLLIYFMCPTASSETVTLHIPVLEDSPHQHYYYHELLQKALESAGHTPLLVPEKLPQLRAKKHLEYGLVSIYWLLGSAERDQKYVPVKVGLTKGMIGKRVLLIKNGNQQRFDDIRSLSDFRERNLTGCMGKDWFDSKVWAANHLNYVEIEGNWKLIYKLIELGRYDYFSRGLNEIVVESRGHPELDIEKNLVLVYDRDFYFYLSATGENPGIKYKQVIEESLQKAKDNGLIDVLISKYWGNDFKVLNYDKRRKIYLETPR